MESIVQKGGCQDNTKYELNICYVIDTCCVNLNMNINLHVT